MKLSIDLETQKELREYVKELMREAVKSLTRADLKAMIMEVAAEKLELKMAEFVDRHGERIVTKVATTLLPLNMPTSKELRLDAALLIKEAVAEIMKEVVGKNKE